MQDHRYDLHFTYHLHLFFLLGTDRQTEESDITVKCRFKIWLENLPVKWYKPAGLEAGNQINTTTVGENCTNLTSASVSAVSTGICDCRVSITRLNLTDAGNNVQGTVSGKCHRFHFHGQAEEDAVTNAPCSTPMHHFP